MLKKSFLLMALPCLAAANTIYQLPTAVLNPNQSQSSKQKESLTVSSRALKKHDTQNITQAIASKDSVSIDSSSSGQTISMRGFGDNAGANTLVLYNGIPLNGISLLGTDLGLVNTQNVQSIQLLPGSAGVRLGNNAVGGVVSINTALPKTSQSSITLTQGWPMYSKISASHTQVIDPTNRIQFTANADKNLGRRKDSKAEAAQFGVNYEHHSAKNRTQFFIQGGPEKYHYPGALTQAQVNADRYQGGDYQGRFNDNQVLSHLGIEQTFTQNWSGHLNISHQQMRGRGTWEYISRSYLENSRSTRFNPSVKWHNDVWSTTLGVMLLRADYFTTGLNQAKQYEADEYLINHLTLPDGWLLSAGGRYVMANQSDTVVQNRNHFRSFISTVGVSWQINPEWYWSLRRAGSFRLPLVDESSYTLPNVGLKPQTGVSYETALLFKHDGFRQRLELYQLNLKNEIAFAPSRTGGFATNINLPRTKREGLILDSHDPLTRIWSIDGSVSWMHNHFKDTGKNIPWTAPLLLSLGSDLQLTPNWHWYAQAEYTGKRYGSSDFENVGGAYGQFMVVNSAIIYEIAHWHFALRVNNIFNRKYYDSVAYSTNGNGFYPDEGVNGAFSITYTE